MAEDNFQFPSKGRAKEDILSEMKAVQQNDVRWRQGRAFSLVFPAGPDIDELLKEAYTLFFSENGLNPTAFPSLRKFETEVVAMAASLLGGDEQTAGNMTSGGTESILMAVKTARDWGRLHKPLAQPAEMVLPVTAHPAFDKASHYFGVKAVRVPVRADFRADVAAIQQAVTPQTVLIVGSAPSYPQGVVDPIAGLARVAQENGCLCHVDACVGGFMLPFVRRLGYAVPDFDFRVPGVTSISADLHKYGYAAKGASVILYRSAELRRCQFFVATGWPGGIYPSPSMTGTRPGGAIAAAWAVLNYLGEEGYLEIAAAVMEAARRIREGITAIPGLRVLSDPEMSVMAIASGRLNIYAVGDEMTLRGWHLDRQQFPPSLHLTVHYGHTGVVEEFLRDLSDSVAAVRRPSWQKFKSAGLVSLARAAVRVLPESTVSRLVARASAGLGVQGAALPGRTAAMYGLMGVLPNRGDLNELVLDLLDGMTRLER
jgi:glutamate/tyrosine decarboxylase-like PLP-dependent enzyme